jgi:hypothetical protein
VSVGVAEIDQDAIAHVFRDESVEAAGSSRDANSVEPAKSQNMTVI